MNSSGYYRAGCGVLVVPVILCMIMGSDGMTDFSSILVLFLLSIAALICFFVFWFIGTAKAVKETYVAVRDSIIDIFTVKREIKRKCPEALKAMILEKQKHSVKVGIYDYQDAEIEKITISGDGVVNDELYSGQTITL